MIYGLTLFGIGLVIFMVAGFITMIRHPKLHNDEFRFLLDPVRKDIPPDAELAFDRMILRDPKSKWFGRIGMALIFAGMAVLYFSTNRAKNSEIDHNVGITSSPVTAPRKPL